MKKLKKYAPHVAVLVLLALVGGQSVLRAQDGSDPVTINNYAEGGVVINVAGGSDEPAFGANGTRFPNGLSTDTTSPSDGEVRSTTLTVTASSTFQQVLHGSSFTVAFTSTAQSTTTAGGLFSIQNTTGDKMCNPITLQYTTAYSGNAFTVSVSTSTTPNTEADGVTGPGLVATTTAGVGDKLILTSHTRPGNYVALAPNGLTASSTPFFWANGVYVNGTHYSTAAGAKQEDYSSMAGRAYLDCFSVQ